MQVLDEDKLKKEIAEIYRGYISDSEDNSIKSKAQKLFFEYIYSREIPNKELMNAIQGLERIGWEYPRSTKTETSWKMIEEEAGKILEKLEK